MSMTQSSQRAASTTIMRETVDGGVQDTSGRGLFGLTIGIVGGFLATYYFIVPFFPKVKATGNVTTMTVLVVAAMTIGGALGYMLTRRKA